MKFESFKPRRAADQSDQAKEAQPPKGKDLLKYQPGVGIKFTDLLKPEKTLPNGKRTEEQEFIYRELKDYLRFNQLEIEQPVIEEARRRRNQLLEARGIFSMSQADFNLYFSSGDFEVRADLKQNNVGDCYLLAAIHAMSRSPHFEIICRSSMERLQDGSWQVRIPLMSQNGEIITITPDELLPQWNRKFLRPKIGGGIRPDLRTRLMPVRGKEGLQVLEAAFMKQKFGRVDRRAAEGGHGDEALVSFGGENFKKYVIDSHNWNEEREAWEYPGLTSIDAENMAFLDHYLDNFDPEIHMATVSTKPMVGKEAGVYIASGKKFLVLNHAYSIFSVDATKRIISLANPWDTSKIIELTFDEFKNNFSRFSAIRINSAKLLDSMETIESSSLN